MCMITTKNVTIVFIFIFCIWRHVSTLRLLTVFYNHSELKLVIDVYTHFDKCRQQESIHRNPTTMIIKTLFYNNRIVDDLLALQFCLHTGYIQSDNIFHPDQLPSPIIVIPRTVLSYLHDVSQTLQLISSGHYVVNIMDGVHMEMMTNVNKLILSTKNRQNEVEYVMKQLVTEVSYMYRILMSYLYFSISYIGIFTTLVHYMNFSLLHSEKFKGSSHFFNKTLSSK